MPDAINSMAEVFLNALIEETNYGRNFEDFHVYDEYPEGGGLAFPCIVFQREPIGTTGLFFGGREIRTVNFVIQLAFKEKSGFVAREHEFLSTEKLVVWYEERMNELVRSLDDLLQERVNIIEISTSSERHFPAEKNQELYGLTYTITITYVG